MKIALAPEAVDDLAAAIEYLQQRNPHAAAARADAIFTVIDRLAAGEFEGPECRLRRTRELARSWPVCPHRIFYRREPDTLVVLRIYHAAKRPIVK